MYILGEGQKAAMKAQEEENDDGFEEVGECAFVCVCMYFMDMCICIDMYILGEGQKAATKHLAHVHESHQQENKTYVLMV
jgi:hypothetical protein